MGGAARGKIYDSSEQALTSSILDHFDSMQAEIREEDKWSVAATMRYMLKWPAAPPIKTVVLGQSPYPTPGEVPFIGAPFAYTAPDAPPSVVVLANTVSTCSAINDIAGLDWQECEELFKNSDKLLQHGVLLANARSSPRFQDEKAARECATLVACLVHLLRRPGGDPSEPIDIICMGVEAQRVCTLITKIWRANTGRRALNVAKCSHPAHLARKERKMYRYCIRLDDPLATRLLTEALVRVVAERNDTAPMPVSQPQDSRYPKRHTPAAPATPTQHSPPPRVTSDSLGVGNWKPGHSPQGPGKTRESLAVGNPAGLRGSSSAPIVPPNSTPVASHTSFPLRKASAPPSSTASGYSGYNESGYRINGSERSQKSMSRAVYADSGTQRRPQRMMSVPLSSSDQADFNMAKALKDNARRAAVVLDAAARTELTQEAMMAASYALSDLASIARIMQDRLATNMDSPETSSPPTKAKVSKSGTKEKLRSDSQSEAGSAVSTLAYVSHPQGELGSRAHRSGQPATWRSHPETKPRQDPLTQVRTAKSTPHIGSAAHIKEVQLIEKALGSSLGPEDGDDSPVKDPGYIDPDRARIASARNGTMRAAQRVSRKLTSREQELVKSHGGDREPREVPLPDQESSVDDDEENDDDFASVASGRLNDTDVSAAILQTMHDDLAEEQCNDPNAPLVGGSNEEKSKLKVTMEGVIWRLYNRQLGAGKDNQALNAQLSA